MLTFVVLTVLVFLVALRMGTPVARGALVAYLVPLFLLGLWGLEYSFRDWTLFRNDELHYLGAAATQEWSWTDDRALWYFLNSFILHRDFALNGWALKIVNIPIYALLLVVLYDVFRLRAVFAAPLFMPYSAWGSIFNLRDTAILLALAVVVAGYFARGRPRLLVFGCGLAMMALLRPIFAVLILLLIGLGEGLLSARAFLKGRFRPAVIAWMLILAAGTLVVPLIVGIANRAVYRAALNIETGGSRYEEAAAEGFASGNRARDFSVAAVRYVVTPLPTSLLGRIFEGGSRVWGLMDDSVRLIHQVMYFGMLAYLAFNLRAAGRAIASMNVGQKVLVALLASYWPVYSLHLYGASHQRLKVPFQLAVFIITALVYHHKQSVIADAPVPDGERTLAAADRGA